MVVVSHGDAVSAGAADQLRRLLRMDEQYRSRWQAHVQRVGKQQLHQSAIAQVLADHLRRTGELPQTPAPPTRTLKEAMARALGGRLTQQSLELFIDAFQISRQHQDELWRSFARDLDSVSRRAVPHDPASTRDPVDESAYRSVSLDELHVIGADGLPHTHRTVQVVRAVAPMDRYTYRFDGTAVAIDVVRGGRPGKVYPAGRPGLWAIDIHLHHVLPPGETAVLEHRTVLRHHTPPLPGFRRGVSGTVGSVDLQVQFHPAKVPTDVWWGRWEAVGEPPRLVVPWQVGTECAVHWSGERVHAQLVGFTWRW